VLGKRGGSLPHADAAQSIGQRRAGDDDERNDQGDHAQISKADPEHQLVGAVGGDVEHTAEQAGLSGLPSHHAVDRVQHQSHKEQYHPGELRQGRSEVENQDDQQQQRESR
jgi:hypothetical protein